MESDGGHQPGSECDRIAGGDGRIDPPPLIYTGAVNSWHAVRKNLRPILLLSIGLVLFTMGLTAVVAHHYYPPLRVAPRLRVGGDHRAES